MVWGCIALNKKGPLVALEYPGGKGGGMTSDRYRDQVLEGPFMDFYEQLTHERMYVEFQQDGASMHRLGATSTWLATHSVRTFQHPPNSPDLNPIEGVWHELKKRIRAHRPIPTTVEKLKAACNQVWEDLDIEDINKYVRSMPARVSAVLEAKGGHTRY
jgi:hypothetical protein